MYLPASVASTSTSYASSSVRQCQLPCHSTNPRINLVFIVGAVGLTIAECWRSLPQCGECPQSKTAHGDRRGQSNRLRVLRRLLTLSHKHFLHDLDHKISLNTPDPLDARRNGVFRDRIVISEGRRRTRRGKAEEEGRKSRTYGGYRRGIV